MQSNAKLEKLRNKIDMLDASLVKVLAKRMRLVEKIGQYKAKNNLPPLDAARWQIVLTRIKRLAIKSNIDPQFIEEIWNLIHNQAIKIEKGNGAKE